MKKESFSSAVFFMLLSGIGLALVGLFGKLGSEQFFLSALIFWRFFAAFSIYLIFLILLKKLKGAPSHLKMNFIRALFILGAQASFFYYIQNHSLLNGMVLFNTGTLFIPIIEWAFLRQKVGKSTWITVAISFIGVLCILQPDRGIFSYASLIGLLSGLCQGISQTLFGITSRKEMQGLSILFLFLFCAALSLIPYLFSQSTWVEGKGFDLWSLGLILLLGVFSIFNQTTRALAYQHSTPSRVSPYLSFSVFISGLFDWWFFNRIPNLLSIIGAILVISAGVLKIYLRNIILRKK